MKNLSFTQFSMWSRCPKQYEYRYLEGLKEKPKSTLIVGRGTHAGLEWGFKDRIEKGEHPPLKEVEEATATAVEEELKAVPPSEIDWGKKGDNPGKVKDDSVGLVGAYNHTRLSLDPEKVESPFELTLKDTDYKIVGRVDLQTRQGALIDLKTSARSPSDDAAQVSEQLTLYQHQAEGVKSLEIHALVRTKVPQVKVLVSPPRTPEQMSELLSDMMKAALLIQTGYFPRALESAINSPCSWCGFYERCRGKKRDGDGE
jgi:putative RecB family exonuclease